MCCCSCDSLDEAIGFWSCSEMPRRFVAVLVANAVRRFVPDFEMSVTGPKTDKKIPKMQHLCVRTLTQNTCHACTDDGWLCGRRINGIDAKRVKFSAENQFDPQKCRAWCLPLTSRIALAEIHPPHTDKFPVTKKISDLTSYFVMPITHLAYSVTWYMLSGAMAVGTYVRFFR